MAVTTTVTIGTSRVGAGLVPITGSCMKVNVPAQSSDVPVAADIGLAVVYQEASPSGTVYYGFTSAVTASGIGTSTDGIPLPTANGVGVIPQQLLRINNATSLYLTATASTPVSLIFL